MVRAASSFLLLMERHTVLLKQRGRLMGITGHALDWTEPDHVRLGQVERHLLVEQILVPLPRQVQQNLALAPVSVRVMAAELLHQFLIVVKRECPMLIGSI